MESILINIGSYLAIIPAFINTVLLVFILVHIKRVKGGNILALLLLAMLSLQLEDYFLRQGISVEMARKIDQVLSFGWLAIGSLFLHYILKISENKLINSKYFLAILYIPFPLFYMFYILNPEIINFQESGLLGLVPQMRPSSLDMLQRYWIGTLVICGLIYFARYMVIKKRNNQKLGAEHIIFFIGILIPGLQGIITQIAFPFIGFEQLPITSTTLLFFSVGLISKLKDSVLLGTEGFNVEHQVASSLSIPLVLLNSHREIIYLNKACSELFPTGIPVTRIPGENLFFSLESIGDLLEKYSKNDKQWSADQEYYVKRPNGEVLHLIPAGNSIYRNGKLQGYLIYFFELSQVTHFNEKINLSNERFKIASKVTADVIWDLDVHSNILYWSDSYGEIFGLKGPSNITDLKHWEDRVHPDDYQEVTTSLESFIQDNKTERWEVEYRYLKLDGSYARILDRGYIIRNGKGEAVRMLGAMQDITEVSSYIKEIERKNDVLKQIAWIQSHELRSPLTKIMSIANFFLDYEHSQVESKILLEGLQKSCAELDEVVRKISDRTAELEN